MPVTSNPVAASRVSSRLVNSRQFFIAQKKAMQGLVRRVSFRQVLSCYVAAGLVASGFVSAVQVKVFL